MEIIKIKARIKSDFVYFIEVNSMGVKRGKLLFNEFFEWLREKAKIYGKLAILIEPDFEEMRI
jgi:predicted PolB exonuclease-like 3'-5' exonuclease